MMTNHLVETSLFLGFPVDTLFSSLLDKLNPEYKALFLQSGEDYLSQVTFQNSSYIGKFVQNEESLAQLELLEANVRSILKKFVVDYPYQDHSLVLFPIPQIKE